MRGLFDDTAKKERPQRMWTVAAGLLVVGAVCVGALAFRALPGPKPDLLAPVAAVASARAAGAAEAVSLRMSSIRLVLEALADKGGARSGRSSATRFAVKALNTIDGLEQLAAYGVNAKTRWVMRPARLGSMKFPSTKAFITEHLEQPDLGAKIGAPFKPRGTDAWWIPVSYVVQGKEGEPVAVLVAFMNQSIFPALLHSSGGSVALLTGAGDLVTGAPESTAPIGASFAEAPGFAAMAGHLESSGVYKGRTLSLETADKRLIGFEKLACCDAIVTVEADIPLPAPQITPAVAPAVHWLTLSAAGLMILLALGLIGRRLLHRTPDPWLDFGESSHPAA